MTIGQVIKSLGGETFLQILCMPCGRLPYDLSPIPERSFADWSIPIQRVLNRVECGRGGDTLCTWSVDASRAQSALV